MSAVAGPRPSRSARAARTTRCPIQKPEPSSPSSQPSPSATATWRPSSTRIAPAPVPAIRAYPAGRWVPEKNVASRSDSNSTGASRPRPASRWRISVATALLPAPAIASTTSRTRVIGIAAFSSAAMTLVATDAAAVSGPTAVGLPLPATA